MKRVIVRILSVCGSAGLAVAALLLLVQIPLAAADQCVAPGGAGGCHPSIAAAIAAASPGDTVRVVAGVYVENPVIAKNLTLLGGFDSPALTTRTPRSSIIDGGGANPVIQIGGGANVTVDGFTLRNGDGTANNGRGGGIHVSFAGAVIQDNLVEHNVGSHDPTTSGVGGGIHVFSPTLPIVIQNNTIRDNTAYSVSLASPADAKMGLGGGLWLNQVPSASILNNRIENNVAARTSPASARTVALGGGGGVEGSWTVVIADNTVQNNLGVHTGRWAAGGGLAIYDSLAVSLTGNTVQGNTAVRVGNAGEGGGIAILGETFRGATYVLRSNEVKGNTAVVTLSASDVYVGGGGVRVWGGDSAADDTLILQDNRLLNNLAVDKALAVHDVQIEGGGLAVGKVDNVSLDGDQISGNTVVNRYRGGAGATDHSANTVGGGVHCWECDHVMVVDARFESNVVAEDFLAQDFRGNCEGGGLNLSQFTTAVVRDSVIAGNTALVSGTIVGSTDADFAINGGGLRLESGDHSGATATVEDNRIVDNVAASRANADGVGVMIHPEGGGVNVQNVSMVVMARNVVSGNVAAADLTMTSIGAGQWAGRPAGGGVFVSQCRRVTLRENQILENITAENHSVHSADSTAEGGGLALINVVSGTVASNIVAANTAVESGSVHGATGENYYPQGGGVMVGCWDVPSCRVSFMDNTIAGNVTARSLAKSGASAVIGAVGGGLSADSATVDLSGNLVQMNMAIGSGSDEGAGGAINLSNGSAFLAANRFLDNTTIQGGGGAPAIWLWQGAISSVNDIAARNSGAFGAGSSGPATNLSFTNDTLYDNGRGVEANDNSTVSVMNTIIAQHDRGIIRSNPAATVVEDYNLLDNTQDYDGFPGAAHDVTGQDPQLVNPAGGDFHLMAGSPAMDAGSNAGAPTVDFEGTPRPLDGDGDGTPAVDIGVDEYQPTIYLPYIAAR